MKIFNALQIREIDAYTIKHEEISSIHLMTRASLVFYFWLLPKLSPFDQIAIFAGPGNNGGDALVVSRLLFQKGYNCTLFFCKIGNSISPDCEVSLQKLRRQFSGLEILVIEKDDNYPEIKHHIVIDGIFGSGLNRPVTGFWGDLLKSINQQAKCIYSIDIPSGVYSDRHTGNTSILATETLSFEFPKFSFLFPENYKRIGNWEYRSIGLSQKIQRQLKTSNYLIDEELIKLLINKREKFQHKGQFGHLCLIGGSFGKIGAVVLAAKAGLRTGCGLLSIQLPECGYTTVQSVIPEAMVFASNGEKALDHILIDKTFSSYAIGCGMGQQKETEETFLQFMDQIESPIVLDADALNILGYHKEQLHSIPKRSIITPHIKEFKRLFGESANDFDRHKLQKDMSRKYEIYIILKGAYSCITTPEGECYFNSTGNPGMATAGSGDVLTGIVASFLSQGKSSLVSCLLAVYLHGLAGDLAVQNISQNSLIASDIIQYISIAYLKLEA